jgi:hypothetical protein
LAPTQRLFVHGSVVAPPPLVTGRRAAPGADRDALKLGDRAKLSEWY